MDESAEKAQNRSAWSGRPLMRWFMSSRLLASLRTHIIAGFERFGVMVLVDKGPAGLFDLIRALHAHGMLLSHPEAYQLYMAVLATRKLGGDVAEVGVYKGGSARLICEAKGDRVLHLFDTFEGLPEVHEVDASSFSKGEYAASLSAVQTYLGGCSGLEYHKGLFPCTGQAVMDRRFSFVHLDADLYESTLDSLGFFYPRMIPGGIIISHNYPDAPGVKRAFHEFFDDKPEPVVKLFRQQCWVTKL